MTSKRHKRKSNRNFGQPGEVGTVLISYQRELRVQPGTLSEPRPKDQAIRVALPRAFYRRVGRIVVGDEIRYGSGRNSMPVVTELLPRRSEFRRSSPEGGGKNQLLFSNLEQLVVVAAAQDPPFRPGLVDRFLVAAATTGLRPILVLNKIDLVPSDIPSHLLTIYRRLSMPCLETSTKSGLGMDELRQALRNRSSAFIGHSGVGKSSLINCLIPEAKLVVGEVVHVTGRGQHITSRSRILRLPEGGFLVDSPGIRVFEPADLEPRQLARLYPGLEATGPCHFSNCLHLTEEDCGVRAGLPENPRAAERYAAYLRVLGSLDPSLPIDLATPRQM